MTALGLPYGTGETAQGLRWIHSSLAESALFMLQTSHRGRKRGVNRRPRAHPGLTERQLP